MSDSSHRILPGIAARRAPRPLREQVDDGIMQGDADRDGARELRHGFSALRLNFIVGRRKISDAKEISACAQRPFSNFVREFQSQRLSVFLDVAYWCLAHHSPT